MWELYDGLIEGIPAGLTAEEVFEGRQHSFVRSGEGCGIGTSFPYTGLPRSYVSAMAGKPLRDLAALIKSWNLVEASIGNAALCAYYNHPERVKAHGIPLATGSHREDRLNDPFIAYQNVIRGKKVAVVGHFHYLEALYAPVCDLKILETDPTEGDYPESAAEYLLPEQDFVILPSYALAKKALPRFLELAAQAYVVIVGPTTPLAPLLFTYGVDDLAGFVVKDGEQAARSTAGSESAKLYASGQKVSFKKADYLNRPAAQGGPVL